MAGLQVCSVGPSSVGPSTSVPNHPSRGTKDTMLRPCSTSHSFLGLWLTAPCVKSHSSFRTVLKYHLLQAREVTLTSGLLSWRCHSSVHMSVSQPGCQAMRAELCSLCVQSPWLRPGRCSNNVSKKRGKQEGKREEKKGRRKERSRLKKL